MSLFRGFLTRALRSVALSAAVLRARVRPSGQGSGVRTALVLAFLLVHGGSVAAAPGDVNLDGTVDVADVLVLERHLTEGIPLGQLAMEAADLAPVVAGQISNDGEVHLGDLVVLLQVVNGQVSLPPVLPAPILDPLGLQDCLHTNPCQMTGTGVSGATVRLIVNGVPVPVEVESDVAGTGGNFSISALLLDGINEVSVQQQDASGFWGHLSTNVTLEYQNNIDRTALPDTIQEFVVWTRGNGEPYDYTSQDLTIASGGRLVIQRGATVRFDSGRRLYVSDGGHFQTNGVPGDLATLTSIDTPNRSAWIGVDVDHRADVDIAGAMIEYAHRAVFMHGNFGSPTGSFWMRGSKVHAFGFSGVQIDGVAAAVIDASEFDNTISSPVGFAIWLEDPTSAEVSGNTVKGAYQGLLLDECRLGAAVVGNEIMGNTTGIMLERPWGSCELTINDNRIHGNPDWNLFVDTSFDAFVIDAEANYWGSTDPGEIEASILDRADSRASDRAYVDFIPARDASHDLLTLPGMLSGPLWSGSPLDANTTYTVVGAVGVPPGETFVFPPNVTLEFPQGSWLRAEGHVRGPAAGPRTLLTGTLSQRGHWHGVAVSEPGGAVDVERLEIAFAQWGIDLWRARTTNITDVLVRDFEEAGVYIDETFPDPVQIADSFIDNSGGPREGICVYADWVNLDIVGSVLKGCTRGVFVSGLPSPAHVTVSDSTVSGNDEGIVTDGHRFTVTQSDLSDNAGRALVFEGYFTTQPPPGFEAETIDARQNWWGTTDPVDINGTIVIPDTGGDPRVRVEYSEPLDGPGGQPLEGTVYWTSVFSNVAFQPADRIIRPTSGLEGEVSFDLSLPATITMKVCREGIDDGCVSPVRSTTQSLPAGSHSLFWDGRKDDDQFVRDEAYFVVLSASTGSGDPAGVYDRVREDDGYNFNTTTPTYNAHENLFWKIELGVYDLQGLNRTTAYRKQIKLMDVGVACDIGDHTTAGFYIDNSPQAVAEGQLVVAWNGRDASGALVDGPRVICGERPVAVKSNHFLVRGTVPNVRGDGQGTAVEVKANPFLITHSYDQTAGITFRVDQDADVDVMLLPPGTVDPDSSIDFFKTTGGADWENQPVLGGVDYTAEWFGYSPTDTNHILTGAEGSHTFLIRARSQATGFETTYFGVLQVRF